MRQWLPVVVFCCLLSCREEGSKTAATGNTTDSLQRPGSLPPPASSYDRITGSYSGDFDGSDIRIVLRHLTGRNAVGYNLHRGLRRNITGSMRAEGSSFVFELLEPGDHPYDGVFRFSVDTASRLLTGTWTPQHKGAGLTEKALSLKYAGADLQKAGDEAVVMGDSLGQFTFHRDGLVAYTYYPREKGAPRQLQTVNGNWAESGRAINIDWAENPVFPDRKSHFAIQGEGDFFKDYFELTLEGDGRFLYASEL